MRYLALVLLLGGVVMFFLRQPSQANTVASVQVGGERIQARIAQTVEEQRVGLAGVDRLEDNEGMLFPYESPQRPSFWMKGMQIPIDLLWIRSGRVVGFEESMTPDDGQKIYSPAEEVDAVLELRAGWIRAHGIVVGALVDIEAQ